METSFKCGKYSYSKKQRLGKDFTEEVSAERGPEGRTRVCQMNKRWRNILDGRNLTCRDNRVMKILFTGGQTGKLPADCEGMCQKIWSSFYRQQRTRPDF